MIPDSWQVPLTADWEFGDNFWAGLFPAEAIAASAQAQEMSFPILSAESFLTVPPGTESTSTESIPEDMEYEFSSSGTNTATAQDVGQDTGQAGESLWPNGVLGLF